MRTRRVGWVGTAGIAAAVGIVGAVAMSACGGAPAAPTSASPRATTAAKGSDPASTAAKRSDPARPADAVVPSSPATPLPTEAPDPDAVVVSGLYPETGAPSGGTYVVLQGRHFRSEERTAQVRFGGAAATVVRFASDGELVVQAPGGAAGTRVDVVVTLTPGGAHTLPAAFRYVEPAR